MTTSTIYSQGITVDSPSIAAAIDSEMGKACYFNRLDTLADIIQSPPRASKAMFPGLLGDIVSLCTKYSEAVPVAVAAYALSWFSAWIGPLRFVQIGDECRRLNNFMLLVGPTGMGKGTSEYGPKKIFKHVEECLQIQFESRCQQSQTEGIDEFPQLDVHEGGLSSGEGLAAAKADQLKIGKDETAIEITDKRFLIIESEFGNVLNMAERQGNTLSHVLRNGYDGKIIRPLTKRDRVCVTDPYFVMVGNITPGELCNHRQNAVMSVNGMLNRMLILWTSTTRRQPIPEPINAASLSELADRLMHCIMFARHNSFECHYRKQNNMARPVTLDATARQLWVDVYPKLVNLPDCEQVQALCRRHRLHVLILASLFALLDNRDLINSCDLTAALSWSDFSRQSVLYVYQFFNEQRLSDYHRQIGEGILRAVASHNNQCLMSDIYKWFKNRIKLEALNNGINYCLTFIPPLLTIEPVQGKRGRPAKQVTLSQEGVLYLASL